LNFVMDDLRFVFRTLRRGPGFATIVILTLGLGIGANTAIFSLMDAALLRPVSGITHAAELVSFERWQAGQLLGDLGYPDYLDYRNQLRDFSGVVAEASTRLSFVEGSSAERVSGALVSGNYFGALGVKPAFGRLIEEPDDREGTSEPAAVLSFAFWQRALGSDPRIIGNSIALNGHTFTVIGVAAQDFRGTSPASPVDIWLPITFEPIAMPRMSADTLRNRASGWLRVFGRLKPNMSRQAAQVEVNTTAKRLAQDYPATNHTRSVTLVEGVGLWSDDRAQLRRFLSLLLLCVGFLQLIACANVANLLLVRSASRQRELAVRLALGATRARLFSCFLAEALLLSLLACLLGILVAPAMAGIALSAQQPVSALRNVSVQLDFPVLIFTLALSLICAFLFASAPVWQSSRVDLLTPLKQGSPAGGRSKSRLRGILVAAQVALSLVLLTAAITVAGAMRRALAADPVAQPQNILLGSLDLTIQGYSAEKGEGFYDTLLQRLQALPGVASASLAFTVPPEESPTRRSIFYPGQDPSPELLQGREFEAGIRVDSNSVSPGFFRTLGIPLLAGRDFDEQDRASSSGVAIVNEALAKRLWPGKDPIGERIAVPGWNGPRQPPVQIVGVVKDVATRSFLEKVPLQLYLPFAQEYDGRARIIVRRAAQSALVASDLREVVRQLDPNVPVFGVEAMPQHVENSLWRQRIAAQLLGAFGFLAVALASIGIYAVVAHGVSQRVREIGIRMAIGAQTQQISALIIGQGMVWVLVGAIVGLPAAVLTTLAMQKGIPGTIPHEPVALGGAALLLAGICLLGSYLPARRAAHVDPLMALRHE
jgi:macrolide transport system ATP-binding/permease protein